MTVLDDLRRRRGDAYDECRQLVDGVGNRQLTGSEQTRFDGLMSQIDGFDSRIGELAAGEKRGAEADEAFERLASGRGGGPEHRGDPAYTAPTGPGSPWLPGMAEYRQLQTDQRAVGTTGAFIPQFAAAQYYDLLRKRTAVLAAGPVLIPVEAAGSVKVPKVTSAVTIAGVPENTQIAPADPGLGEIVLDPKKFAALTLVAREAVEDSRPELRQVVANSLIRDMAVELDRQLVTGDGAGENLRGLRNVTGVSAGPDTGANGSALTFDFLADTLAAYDQANADPDRAAWIMHSRSWSSVRKLQDANNRPIVSVDPSADVQYRLWGRPVFISNSLSVTETQGTSTNASSLLLADMSQVTVAVSRQIELVMSEHFAFDSDQVAVRVTCRYDIGVPQPAAVVLTVGLLP